MKKYCICSGGGYLNKLCARKIFKIMRNILLLIFVTVFQAYAEDIYSQNTKISLALNNVTVANVLEEIQNKSEFYFLFNAKLIDVEREVSISMGDKKISEILTSLFSGTGVNYMVYDRQIILTPSDVIYLSAAMQQLKITGTVVDEKGNPLPGVTVLVKGGSTVGTITGADGKFSLAISESAQTLVFSFVGMQTQEVAIGSSNVYNVTLPESLVGLDEVVVIGYGTAKKSDLTGSIVRVEGETFKNQAMTQLTQMLTGTVAGFNANQGTGAAGGSSLEVRGPTSLSAGTNPLIVLDGVIYNGDISDINPADIASVDILKDASAAAVFGSKAASGVIIVTTSKGRVGKPIINFTNKIGISEITNKNFRPYNAEEYLNWRRDLFKTRLYPHPDWYWNNPNDLPSGVTLDIWRNATANPNDDNTLEWANRLNLWPTEIEQFLAGKSINWMNEIFQKGLQQDYDLSMSGGTKDVTYYWSVGYVNNKGIIRGDQFSAIRSRLNLDLNVTDWLKVGVNSQYSFRDESGVPAQTDIGWQSPFSKIFEDDGTVRWHPNDYTLNPLQDYYGEDRLQTISSLFASMFAEVKLPLGITYRLSFQPRIQSSKDYNFWSVNTFTGASIYNGGYGTRKDYSQFEWMMDNILKWNKEIGIHNFDLTLLYNAEQVRDFTSSYENQTFLPSDALGFHGMSFGTKPSVSSNDTQAGGNAMMARMNYTLLGKYLLTASIRRDGYSAFGQQNPTAFFPAVSLAWKISDENFFNKNLINRMKLRLSWGVNGNRDIGIYSSLAQLGSNLYSDGSHVVMGTYTNTLSNPGLRWERTSSINTGLDIGLFKDRIDLTVDYYDMTTTDLLMNRQLPEITGFSSITANLGELGNKGFEMTLNTVNVNQSKFTWRSSLVFSLNRNKIKKLFGATEQIDLGGGNIVTRLLPDYSNEWFPGKAIDAVWDYKLIGIWQLGEAAAADVYGQQPGFNKAEDVNKDGVYSAKEDKQFIGFRKPRYRLGLRNEFDFLKNFTASVFIRADLGQIAAVPWLTESLWSAADREGSYKRPYWTPTDPNTEWAMLSVTYQMFGGGIQIYQPSSFVRIQDVSLSYTLPTDVAKQIKIGNLRFFGTIRNLCRFTEWRGYDPESGFSPMPRTYTVGLSLTL